MLKAQLAQKSFKAEPDKDRGATKRVDDLRLFRMIEPEGLNVMAEEGKWVELEPVVDSGVTRAVVGEQVLSRV